MMLEFLKKWIISVVTMVIFMALIDLILPENNLKKYARFVTGLLVIVTILSPVFKLFAKNASIETYITQYSNAFDTESSPANAEDVQNNIEEKTREVFKENLEKEIESKIKNQTSEDYSVVSIDVELDSKSSSYGTIKSIALKKTKDNTIEPVNKISIGKGNSDENDNEKSYEDDNVKKLLLKEFNIKSSNVKFVK